ncbi:MAG: cytochrome c peroxidase [Myxococcota bacterium]
MRPHFAHLRIAPILLLGCAAAADGPALPWEASAIEAPPGLVQDATADARVALGRLLFYDPILSADGETACATCHSEIWGMSDGLDRSVGVGGDGPTGPGRSGPNVTRRNSLALWNVAYRTALFWDGRSTSLEEQALLPIEEPEELGRELDAVVRDIAANAEYERLFASAFPNELPVTSDQMGRALADFQRTLVSARAPYDQYVAGDEDALDPTSVDGMFLFAEAGCADCHVPPHFMADRYHHRNAPPAPGIDDRGRAEVTGASEDMRAFRVPSLRNLRETGPYFHGGTVATLEEAVAHEVREQVASGASRALTEDETAAIARFLRRGLIDRSAEPDRPDEVPSGLAVPLDGFRIIR